MMRFFYATLCFLYFYSKSCVSQTLFSNVKYRVGAGTYLSTSGLSPFWLRSNQYGVEPLRTPILTLRAAIHKEYDSTTINQKRRKFSIGYGVSNTLNIGQNNKFHLQEAYIKIRYGGLEFYGGRRKEIVGLVDTTLTSGSYIWSGNATPIPKIQVSIPNYYSIIGKGLISIKGSFAHGWFGKQSFVNHYHLHQKSFYGRLGREKWPIQLFAGVNHMVQWGGIPNYNAEFTLKNGSFPNSFYAFLYSVYPSKKLLKQQKLSQFFTQHDTDNRVGNQVGSVDLSVTINLKTTSFSLYRQFPLEVGQLRYLTNADDGLYGLKMKLKENKIINQINFEYLFTINQGTYLPFLARTLKLQDGHPGEAERYFNHDQYYDGWTYYHNTIGTPFLMNDIYINPTLRNDLPQFIITNNKVKVAYFAVLGSFLSINYKLRASVSKNFGEPRYPYENAVKQTSLYLGINKRYQRKKIDISLNISLDKGKLMPNSSAIQLLLERYW